MKRATSLTAAALALALATLSQAASPPEAIGRLFFTPEERRALDAARERPERPRTAVEVQPVEPVRVAPVTLNGVVRRSDGATTVWINDVPVAGSRTADGIRVAPVDRGSVTVSLPDSGRRIELGVGQRLDVETGEVLDPYRSPAQARDPGAERRGRDASPRDRERPERGASGAAPSSGGR